MKKITGSAASTILLFILFSGASGQVDATQPEYETAIVKPGTPGDTQKDRGMLPSGLFSLRNRSLKQLIQVAYKVGRDSVAGGPNWLNVDSFDIVAKAPPGTTVETNRLMLQSLLAQEFKLLIHTEQKPTNVFVLVTGKGDVGLHAASDPGPGPGLCRNTAEGTSNREMHLVCKNIRMSALAQELPNFAPREVDRQVVDLTGLTGTYDISLTWTKQISVDQGGLTMLRALDRLGLNLLERKLLMTVIAIDHVEKQTEVFK
jgi:uncharacterized protein (TIGR03435 family)